MNQYSENQLKSECLLNIVKLTDSVNFLDIEQRYNALQAMFNKGVVFAESMYQSEIEEKDRIIQNLLARIDRIENSKF